MNRDKLPIIIALLVLAYAVALVLGALWLTVTTPGSVETSPANALYISDGAGVLGEVLGDAEDGGVLEVKTKDEEEVEDD